MTIKDRRPNISHSKWGRKGMTLRLVQVTLRYLVTKPSWVTE